MRLALIQQVASGDKDANIRRGLEAVDRAARAGAEVIAFAELAFERFHPQVPATGDVARLAEPVPGGLTDRFAERARQHGVVLVLNLFESDRGRCFDCSPVIDSDGTLLGRTRMVHITEYEGFHEQGYYQPGNTGAPVYETRVGRLGVAICYDRHYPEYMRALALGGAELVVVPQAGTVGEWPEGLYEAEMRVAAFQNGYFVALCNRVGREERLDFAGESFVCAPDGRVLARAAGGREEVLMVDLDLSLVAGSHARRLFLRDRRPELYSRWLAGGADPSPPQLPAEPLRLDLGEGLILRGWGAADGPALQRHADDPLVAGNLRDIFPHPYTEADAAAWIARCAAEPERPMWAVELNGEAVGGIGLHALGDVLTGTAEIGYWIGRAHWGKGIASLAVRRVVDVGFASFGFRRIQAEVFGWNSASVRVLQKAGFVQEGRMRSGICKSGRVGDRLMFGKVLS